MTSRSDTQDPMFTPDRGSFAARIGDRMRDHRPITVALAVWVVGFLVLGVVMVGLGLLLIHVLAPEGATRLDDSVSQWFVLHRTPTLDTVTRIGSDIGSTGAIIGVAVVAGIVLAIGRHWRQIGFLAATLTLEFSVFLISTVLVDRPRPDVPRLDVSPPTSSYPSGHTAASIALYCGLALVIWSLVRSAAIRTIAWIVAVALPIFVGVSRLYRGMHHLTDVLASVLLGCGALLFALLATRSAVGAHEEHAHEVGEERSHPVRVEATS